MNSRSLSGGAPIGGVGSRSAGRIYAVGFAAGVIVLVLRAAHGHTSPGAVVEAVSLIRRSQRQLGGATDTAGSFMTANITAGRLLWLEDYAAWTALRTRANGALRRAPATGSSSTGVGFTYPGSDTSDTCVTSTSLRGG